MLAKSKDYLLSKYGSILGTRISPISIFAVRYFDKNYGKSLRSIPEGSKILEVGSGNASFIQYLLYKRYRNITACEIAEDNVQSLECALGDRIEVVHRDVISYLEASTSRYDLIHAGQLIEHFAYDDLVRFLECCYNSLNSGGYMIFETINCANVTHGLYLRYCDYTHQMGFTPRSLKHFLMAVGDFSEMDLIEIRPPGILDCLYYICRRLRGSAITLEIGQTAKPTERDSSCALKGSGRLMGVLMRSLSIRLSRWVSFFFLRPYEFEKIGVYTPFFAVVARKA